MAIQNALVTGGGGFLGSAIVRRLLGLGAQVRSFARHDYPALRAAGATVIRGDLDNQNALIDAARGCDVVFHVAAKAGIWGDYSDYHRANVIGSEHVLQACRVNQIPRLIYTSSPSVVFDGRDMEGVNESVPYASSFATPYPETKAIAERHVLNANCDSLATVALRPHLIWGPGDNHLVPRIIARAHRLRLIGGINKRVDTVYIDNAADAHILAAQRLAPGAAPAGRAYFITNGEPRPIWDIVNGILAAAGLPPVTRSIPRWLAQAVAVTGEAAYRLAGVKREPPLTKFLIKELCTAHWFDISAARRDLGYEPRVSIDEGMQRLAAALRGTLP